MKKKAIQLVAGLSIKSKKPRVWDCNSPYYIPGVRAIMVSYSEFHRMPSCRRKAMGEGIHNYLGIPRNVKVYLDNGAYYFSKHGGNVPVDEYEEFVKLARPDWWPIPQDYIPDPKMGYDEQKTCFKLTMDVNRNYQHDGYVPVIHIGHFLKRYLAEIQTSDQLSTKPSIALGGIVPNLLRAPKAMPYIKILNSIKLVREASIDKELHVFGIGGTATLHIAALFGINSVDSSGWRNRAARGIIQLQGSGDRVVAELGSWRGRRPNLEEWDQLEDCSCPACQEYGLDGLKASGVYGFCNRATHNLWILEKERELIDEHLTDGTYSEWYKNHLNNSIYRPMIDQIIKMNKIY